MNACSGRGGAVIMMLNFCVPVLRGSSERSAEMGYTELRAELLRLGDVQYLIQKDSRNLSNLPQGEL